MIFIPAIDIRGGKVVRLMSGAFELELEYGDDPVSFAKRFESEGATLLHVVDLDGALGGEPKNLEIVRHIREATRLRIEFGGGLRNFETIDKVIAMGIDRAILGTKGLEQDFLRAVLKKHGEKIAVSVDASQGIVQMHGWTQRSDITVQEFLEKLRKLNLKYLIFTNISKDGMMQGPDISGLMEVLNQSGEMNVILSGGISSIEDLKKVSQIKHLNFYGVIAGRAIYEKKITVSESVKVLSGT